MYKLVNLSNIAQSEPLIVGRSNSKSCTKHVAKALKAKPSGPNKFRHRELQHGASSSLKLPLQTIICGVFRQYVACKQYNKSYITLAKSKPGRCSKGRTTVKLIVNLVMRYATSNVKHNCVGLT
eukprot:785530-Pleurochrysis_carterae.AAC.1